MATLGRQNLGKVTVITPALLSPLPYPLLISSGRAGDFSGVFPSLISRTFTLQSDIGHHVMDAAP